MKRTAKLFLGLFFVALAILILISLVKYASIFGFLMVYPYVVSKISGFGMNPYLAQAIGIVVAVPLWYAIFRLFFSWKKDRRLAGMITIAAFFALHSLAMFLIQGDSLVHPIDGPAMAKFCTVNPLTGEIQVFEQALYDKFGQQAQRCSPELIEKYEKGKQFATTKNYEVTLERVESGFVSPATGKALFFYCTDPEGTVHFYASSGYCPWGGELQVITGEIERKEREKLQKKNEQIRLEKEKKQNLKLKIEKERRERLVAEKKAKEEARKRVSAEKSLEAERNKFARQEKRRVHLENRKAEDAKAELRKERVAKKRAEKKAKEKAKKAAQLEKDRKHYEIVTAGWNKNNPAASKTRNVVAYPVFRNIEWNWPGFLSSNCRLYFRGEEKHGVSVTYTDATMNAWVLKSKGESPAQYKQRTPIVFSWKLAPEVYLEANLKHHTQNARFMIDLTSYYKGLKGGNSNLRWIEVTISGKDANDHYMEYTFQ